MCARLPRRVDRRRLRQLRHRRSLPLVLRLPLLHPTRRLWRVNASGRCRRRLRQRLRLGLRCFLLRPVWGSSGLLRVLGRPTAPGVPRRTWAYARRPRCVARRRLRQLRRRLDLDQPLLLLRPVRRRDLCLHLLLLRSAQRLPLGLRLPLLRPPRRLWRARVSGRCRRQLRQHLRLDLSCLLLRVPSR